MSTPLRSTTTLVSPTQLSRYVAMINGRPNPHENTGLSAQHYWMQVVIRNVTQFPIHHTGSAISSGRYWPALQPHTLAPFTVDQFGVCNLESNVGSGATGGTSFQMVLENDGQGGGQKVDFSIGWADPLIGQDMTAVVLSANARDGYAASTTTGTQNISTGHYTGRDTEGLGVILRFDFSATVVANLAVVTIRQVFTA